MALRRPHKWHFPSLDPADSQSQTRGSPAFSGIGTGVVISSLGTETGQPAPSPWARRWEENRGTAAAVGLV